MTDLNEILIQLIDEAKKLSPASVSRQQKIRHEIYIKVMNSGKLWREYNKDYYEDALHDMWEYCFNHLEEYDPTKKQVTTWLNDELKKALDRHKYKEEIRPREKHQEIHKYIDDDNQLKNNSLDNLSRNDLFTNKGNIESALEIWDKTLQWVENDPDEVLRNTCFQKRPEINAQVIILKRLPPEIPWKGIAQEFNLNESEAKNLPKWYNRSCLPLLRKFGYEQGYLEK